MSRVTGLYGFDVRGPTYFRLHYWGDLLKILRGTVGAEVFVTAVPGYVLLLSSTFRIDDHAALSVARDL
jgi:hypothetical protein